MMCFLTECTNALRWGNSLRVDLFKAKNLAYLIMLAVMVSLSVGLMLFLVDPNIKSLHDGIWSAWVTMTHVGYGDVVPTSFLGRILAACLILLGLLLFSLFTGLVSVALLGRNIEALGMDVQKIEPEINNIQSGEEKILKEIARLHQRMDALEKILNSTQ